MTINDKIFLKINRIKYSTTILYLDINEFTNFFYCLMKPIIDLIL